ncbi:MAG TPA: helix-turn-helix domain-containing protein [Proteiniphilum sp.]|nr:helix-turn-helix domain-containing protein [Proteiniphilum sp.]HPD85761.1 helix-turn-helix domain-containing protein [Proteiniphilum sp.]HPJ50976.1 helix-turn-helix domain-containing protein [Proteiniphilum sp.]HPR20612.1 helix-turn-helix domain-containing protein [Proteiniphilum sp.]
MDELMERLERIEKGVMLQKNVLTFDEAVMFTGLAKSYLYKLTASGKIPYYKPSGKLIYFDRSELERWMLRNPIKTADEIEQQAVNYCHTNRANP